jgi:hypothetical protein
MRLAHDGAAQVTDGRTLDPPLMGRMQRFLAVVRSIYLAPSSYDTTWIRTTFLCYSVRPLVSAFGGTSSKFLIVNKDVEYCLLIKPHANPDYAQPLHRLE